MKPVVIWNTEILALNFKISFQWKPECKRPTTPLIAVQYISGAVCLSRGGVDARWLPDFFFFFSHLISTTTTTRSTTTTHARTNTHTHTHIHAHFLLQALWSGCPLPVWSCTSAACWSWSVGCKCWTVIFINGTGWMSGALWGQHCALSRSGGGCRGEGECSRGKKKMRATWKKGTKPGSGLTPVPIHTADRPTLFLQASV